MDIDSVDPRRDFVLLPVLAMEQELKGNLPSGTQMAKKKNLTVVPVPYSIQNGGENVFFLFSSTFREC